MAGRSRALLVGCIAASSLVPLASRARSESPARGTVVAGRPALAPAESVRGPDSLLERAPAHEPEAASSGGADSLPLVPGALDSLGAPAADDDSVAIRVRLDRIAAAGGRLSGDDRPVFDELVAAAREMLQAGDLEAARLLAADALDFLRQERP